MSVLVGAMTESEACPFVDALAAARVVAPEDTLELPLHKRMVVQYALNEEGVRELRLFHGEKEISFDEPELFVFGETLAKQSRFRAGSATEWGDGYAWDKVRDLFETLIEEGVLQRAAEHAQPGNAALDRARPSPLPLATCMRPRTWSESEEITRTLTGRSVETGYLEVFIPVFRVGHIALDSDGRHVGEANVFPRALRTETPTEWMTCIYPGTRYMADAPMNVTALKAMREHWGQIMAALHRIRAAFLNRFPDARKGWTVGHLERLATAVLCVPTYQWTRCDRPVPNGQLHPVLSSMFRVTDGLRMVMHEMLFIPVGEPTRSPDDAVTSAEILEYAERNYSFHSETGVCAGPRHMVQEFLSVIVDGEKAEQYAPFAFDPQVEMALSEVDAAIDYALLGLQTYAVTFSFWPLMTRTYERLATIARAAAIGGAAEFLELDRRMSAHLERLKGSTYLAHESWRADRDHVYADMYENCGRGVLALRPFVTLDETIAPIRSAEIVAAESNVRDILVRQLGTTDASAHHIETLLACVMDFVTRTQGMLREAAATQTHTNRLLRRSEPMRPIEAPDFDIYHRVQGPDAHGFPFLFDELEAALGIRFEVDPRRIRVTETPVEKSA